RVESAPNFEGKRCVNEGKVSFAASFSNKYWTEVFEAALNADYEQRVRTQLQTLRPVRGWVAGEYVRILDEPDDLERYELNRFFDSATTAAVSYIMRHVERPKGGHVTGELARLALWRNH